MLKLQVFFSYFNFYSIFIPENKRKIMTIRYFICFSAVFSKYFSANASNRDYLNPIAG